MPTILLMRSKDVTSEERAAFEKSFNGQDFEIKKGDVSSRRFPEKWLAECRKAGSPQEVLVVTTMRRLLCSKITDQASRAGYGHSALLPK